MLGIGVAAALSFSPAGGGAFPTVTAHGMGDSCFNSGMKEITALIGTTLGTYSVCIPTGNRLTDTTNGFLMTMNDNVDVFAAKILKDAQLKDGFNCVGFSQGVSLCRGYVQKYNGVGGYPAVQNFLSVHGTCSGVAGFPNCDPDGLLGPVCKPLAHLVGDIAYTAETQKILFQIDYYRDPNRVGTAARSSGHLGEGLSAPAPPQGAWWHWAAPTGGKAGPASGRAPSKAAGSTRPERAPTGFGPAGTDAYKQNSQIADWNNEGVGSNATYKANFVKVKRFIMIKALKDTMIYPNEGEWCAQRHAPRTHAVPQAGACRRARPVHPGCECVCPGGGTLPTARSRACCP